MKGQGRSRVTKGAITSILGLWLAIAGWAYLDVDRRETALRVERSERLVAAAAVADRVHGADRALLDGELERLRMALREDAIWSTAGPSRGAASGKGRDRASIAARRRDALLRRAIDENEALVGLELVVAGHEGLALTRFGRDDAGGVVLDERGDATEGLAKALWYADEVQRAVAANGRRVERGETGFDVPPAGTVERPLSRVVVALHAPGELVQGALAATIDTTHVAERLAPLIGGDSISMRLTDMNGRVIGDGAPDEAEVARTAALVARSFEDPAANGAFEADGRLVLSRPLAGAEDGLSDLVILLEVDAPATGHQAWLTTDWPFVLVAFSVVAGTALFLLLWGGSGARSSAGRGEGDARTNPAGIALAEESFVLRDWLADVRSCLEREAARRGQGLEVRCERALPDAIDADPGWLGGLIVAMGREALDASGGDPVCVEVSEDAGETLRIEVEAGDVGLGPVCGMEAVAVSIGGRIESTPRGGMALVVSSLLA